MKKNFICIFLLAILLNSGMCQGEDENCHNTIPFQNSSNKTIYTQWFENYPDTLYFRHFANPIKNPSYYEILPNKINKQALKVFERSCYEDLFNNRSRYNDTLMIYVFDKEVLENNEWEEVGKNYLVLQRYDLTLEDLRYLDWKLTYPPSEEMRYMKMYPPYPEE